MDDTDFIKPMELSQLKTEAECYRLPDGNLCLLFTDATHWSVIVLHGCYVAGYDTGELPLAEHVSDLAAAAVAKMLECGGNADKAATLCSSCLGKIN